MTDSRQISRRSALKCLAYGGAGTLFTLTVRTSRSSAMPRLYLERSQARLTAALQSHGAARRALPLPTLNSSTRGRYATFGDGVP